MRVRVLTFAAVSALAPLFGQPSGAQGVGNEKLMQDAVRGALKRTLRSWAPARIRNLRMSKPKKLFSDLRLPAEMCAVPLLDVPISTDLDNDIVRKHGASSADNKMIVPPAVGVCPTSRGE